MRKLNSVIGVMFFSCILLSLNSCKKNHDESSPTSNLPITNNDSLESYTNEQIEMLDSSQDVKLTLDDLVLPNGEIASKFLPDVDSTFFNDRLGGEEQLGPLDEKNLLIKKFDKIAIDLVDRSKHQYAQEGDNEPAQNGIGYSYGAKDYTVRQQPSISQCNQLIYGLDCSGLMYQLFKNAGITTFPDGPAQTQKNSDVISTALKTAYPELNKIKVEDLGALATSKFMNGDIVYWVNDKGVAFHIGMILTDVNGNITVFQSNGSPGGTDAQCDKNLGLKRGPRTVKLDDKYWFGGNLKYGIVRFNFEIEGKWDFHMKCVGTNEDVLVLPLDFPPSETAEFTISKDYTDYDGSADNTTFYFKYDNTTSILSCDFVTTEPGFERKDSFSLKLQRDDSGYVTATNTEMTGGSGCPLDVRLVNTE